MLAGLAPFSDHDAPASVQDLAAAGVDIRMLGPMPTPGIAYLTRTLHACAGIVISASHNPHYDNGIKFFSAEGTKLPDDVEARIEAQLGSLEAPSGDPGMIHGRGHSGDDYVDHLLSVLDGRDLTAFQVRCMEERIGTTFNVTGPHPSTPLTRRGMLEACRAASDSDAEFVWADQDFLDAHEVSAWTDMPCWLPGEGEWGGFCRRNIDNAVAAGLTFRPVHELIRELEKITG